MRLCWEKKGIRFSRKRGWQAMRGNTLRISDGAENPCEPRGLAGVLRPRAPRPTGDGPLIGSPPAKSRLRFRLTKLPHSSGVQWRLPETGGVSKRRLGLIPYFRLGTERVLP